MANRDGIVSIGFDYKKELDEVCATIEKELNNLGGDINLSDGIKKQMAEVKKMIADMKKDIGSSFDKITETKLDTKTFESFKKDVNKRIREINKEVTTLKEQFSTLDGSANVNGIVQQFANLKKHVEDSNASISEFINNSEKLGKSVIISPNLNTDTLKNDVVKIRKLLTDLDKEDLDFGYTNKSTKELTNDLEGLVDKYYRITDLIDEMKMSMNGMDTTTQEYKNQQVQLSKLSLELIKCSAQMDDLFAAKNAEKINVDKIISIDELDDIFAHVKDISSKVKLEAKNIVESIELSNTAVKNVNNNTTSDLSNKSNIEVHISTKQSTINKQLDEMIDNLQQRAANKPIIAPVKLRVDSEYEKTTKDASAPALTENQINEARKDVESVVPGLEKAFNNSMRIATNKAVENAKESIKAVREFFETNPITVHLTIPEDERLKISKSILSENGKTTVDISGQVDKARKSVKGLSEDLEKSQLLIKDNAQNAKNLSLEKLVNSLSETMTQFSELKGIISSIQNMENTIARTSGISSTSELVEQWNIVEKTIINATKLDGDFRKNANMGKIVSEYQKYIDMGGTNALSSIDKIKDNETTINSILSKMKELKSQDIENGSIQKLSVDLDGVITKFDELISTVKTATNALYKIIKQGNVSDLDKQWSSISNKFKSIADESGKINLSKQKTDIKELMDMYQKYENAGGANSLMSLTDNVETLRKLDKEYQKLNQTQSVDNSSTIEKESESFKNVEKSVDSLTTAIGDTKVQAINVEATAMEDAAEREIMAIRSILDNLDLVVNRLKDIKGIKLPKIEVKNIDVVEKTVESLENTGNKSNISSENSIVESQNKIQEELKETQIEVEKTTSKYQGLLNAAQEKIKNDSSGYYSDDIGYEALTDFQWVESAKRANFVEPFEENYEKLSNSIDKIESDFRQSVISFDEAIDQLVEAYKKYDSATNTHVSDFDFLNNKQSNLNETILDTATALSEIDKFKKETAYINDILSIDVDEQRNNSIKQKYEELFDTVKNGSKLAQDAILDLSDHVNLCLGSTTKLENILNRAGIKPNSIGGMSTGGISLETANFKIGENDYTLLQDYITGEFRLLDAQKQVINSYKDYETVLHSFNNSVEELKQTQEQAEQTAKSVQEVSNPPIKDVFQGDESSKINEVVEATNNLADAENRLNIVEDKKSAQKYWQGRFKDSISDMTKPNDELVRMNKYYSDLEKLNEKITSAQNKVNNANIEVKKLKSRDVQSDNYVKAVKNYKNAITELQNYINSLNKNGIQSQDDIDELNRLQKAVDEVSKSIKNMSAPEKGTSIAKSSTVFLKIEELRDKYKGMSNDMLNELDKLERKFREAGNSLDTGKAIGELKQFETQLIKTGTATNSLWSAMKDKAFYNFANQLGTMFSFYDLINVGREIVTNIKEVDTALTELRKVSDATEQRLDTNFKNSTDTAKELGATISDVISATADWSRMGYNIDQAEELARVSTLYKNVGDGIDIETANNSLISTLQGFQLDTSEAESIIDKFNEVAKFWRNCMVTYG